VTTDAITCPSCNAADHSTADAHGVHVCEYCGIRYRLRHGEPQALGPVPVPPALWRSPPVLLAIAAALGVGILIGRSTIDPAEPSAPVAIASPLPAPAPAAPAVVPPYTPPPAGEAHGEFRHDNTRPGYKGSIYLLGWITNTSAFPIQKPSVTVVLVDADGREVGVDKGYASVSVLEPGAATPLSIMLSDAPTYARIEFEVDARAATPELEVPNIRVVDPVAERQGEGKRWSLRGRIANDGDVPLRHASVTIFGVSEDGKNLGAATTYADVEILAPGQSARWSLHADDFIATPSRFEYLPEASFVD
jgi:hypothetical protein